MEIKLKTGRKLKTISHSYAPRHGYENEILDNYWNNINSHFSNLDKKNSISRCTDNNGQLCQNQQNNDKIGKWTTSNNLNELNGIKLSQTCINRNLVAGNTFIHPKHGNKERLATWHNHDGSIARQIDYFMISKECRNWITNIENNKIANARQYMQHKALIITIRSNSKNTPQKLAIIQESHMISTNTNQTLI